MAVAGMQITNRSTFANGRRFGSVGVYERIDGMLQLAVSPDHPRNAGIVDLDLAPRDGAGHVRFRAGFTLIQPVDAGRSSGRLLVSCPNRGARALSYHRSSGTARPTEGIDPGDGLLLDRGWSIAWVGWQWDVPTGRDAVVLEPPEGLGPAGRPVTGQVLCQFQPNRLERDHPLGDRGAKPYPAADPQEVDAVLTVRDWPGAPRTVIPRERWRFAHLEGDRLVDDPLSIWVEGGFEPGRIYELVYTTNRAPVVGAGLLAFRDGAAFLRRGAKAVGSPCNAEPRWVYTAGSSQSGRFLRSFLSAGLNLDENDAQVFDGAHIHIAGARRGEFNQRFGQPSVSAAPGLADVPPFSYEALLERQRAQGGVPFIVATNSSWEYWRGTGALVHIDPDTGRDLQLPAEVRIYHFAGTQHTSGSVPPPTSPTGDRGVHPANTADYSCLFRAALINLDAWVAEGVNPPPSAYPRIGEGTAVRREEALDAHARFSGVTMPIRERMMTPHVLDLGPEAHRGIVRVPAQEGAVLPTWVAAVDADGNDLGGVRPPDVAVPLATHTAWNPRHPEIGGEGQIVDLLGSTLPFAVTATERSASGDPRPAVLERYRDRDDYLTRVREAAKELAARRYLLAEDVDAAVEIAAGRWDWLVAAPVPAGRAAVS